ncbi:hypothetical protein AB0N17_03240 [Streptomyces sp. NPDC051133]|uniref:hypothetical protein n=1 Tax=Streptomyces sp. NPDC051133 TaxID=3155521 RepID=UPI00343C76B2
MTDCPTPTKMRYATKAAAEAAAARAVVRTDTTLRPYECPCTWWHLSSKPGEEIPEPDLTDQVTIERLVSIPDSDFREIVVADTRGDGLLEERAALRHPRALNRWRDHLGELTRDIEQQLADRRTDKTLITVDWRKRATAYRDTLVTRATECRRRRSEAHVALMRRHDVKRLDQAVAAALGKTARELRAEAGEVAVDQLITAHRDEFEQYLVDAYQALGLQIPERFEERTRTKTSEPELTGGAT